MAMDKEQLLSWFQAHYLSRQEVLYKLPLNLSIDSFWTDLLNRRKAGATVLPLYNASGMPYWYVLTEKMITASERLCEEAMAQDGAFDPYRTQMTSAMTEEMFFTSFVEGAQIPLQQAMDFLQRGTEPEDIQEQMIWNNRHAWAEMTATLYRPLDEGFIKALAFMLTEEMDGCAQDYRQTDNHPIAAMGSEPYDVPPSYTLPDRMREYCAFLSQPDIHPLIKSAVAQAYILVARPFPEGNERLSRMLSSAVLLRCGYDFFRDISLSAVIARENYRYYKAMKEILRPENGGDLTYFMEYYLELLVRAIDDRKERLRRREQEALEKEREMAAQPLKGPETQPVQTVSGVPGQPLSSGKSEEKNITVSRTDNPPVESSLPSCEEFLNKVEAQFVGPRKRFRQNILARINEMLTLGKLSFTVQEWSNHWHISDSASNAFCLEMMQMGLLTRRSRAPAGYIYTFLVDPSSVCDTEIIHEDLSGKSAGELKTASEQVLPSEPAKATDEMLLYLLEMQKTAELNRRRIYSVLISMLREGKRLFTLSDWKRFSQSSKAVCTDDIRKAVNMGLARRNSPGTRLGYRIAENPPSSQRISDLTIAQKYYLTRIHDEYANGTFTVDECAEMLGLSKNQATVYINDLFERGITDRKRVAYNRPSSYFLLISPKDHPECFSSAEIEIQPQKFTAARRRSAMKQGVVAVG